MIDHAAFCTGYPCTCRHVIVSALVPNVRRWTCSVCKGAMWPTAGRAFVHADNGLTTCPDMMEESEQWE